MDAFIDSFDTTSYQHVFDTINVLLEKKSKTLALEIVFMSL